MTFYVAAYDTEAVYPWWVPADGYHQAVRYEGARLDECLDGVRAVAEVHLRHNAPASFFIVARLAEAAGPRLREILDHDLSRCARDPGRPGEGAPGAGGLQTSAPGLANHPS